MQTSHPAGMQEPPHQAQGPHLLVLIAMTGKATPAHPPDAQLCNIAEIRELDGQDADNLIHKLNQKKHRSSLPCHLKFRKGAQFRAIASEDYGRATAPCKSLTDESTLCSWGPFMLSC